MPTRTYHLRVWTRMAASPESAERAFGGVGDSPMKALCSHWEHQAQLEPVSDGCRRVDDLTFTPRLPASRLVAEGVQLLLTRAHRRAAQGLNPDARATAVAMLRLLPDET